MGNMKTKLQIAKDELDRITTQADSIKEEIDSWKVNTAPLATNEEIKELYDASVITFSNLLGRIEPMVETLSAEYSGILLKNKNGEDCDTDTRKFQKALTKLDFLVSGLEAYLWVCKKDIKELCDQHEWE